MEDYIVKQIETLVYNEQNVLETIMQGKSRYFLYSSFESSYSSSSTSIDFCKFHGVEITEFLLLRKHSESKAAYLQAIEKYIQEHEPMNIRFNKASGYYTYTK